MEIRVNTGKMTGAGADLLALSRRMRSVREEVTDVRRQLRQMSQLDECRQALEKQEESLSLLAARLTYLSSAMEQISGAYAASEEKNVDRLEEQSQQELNMENIVMYRAGDYYQNRINQILYK